MTWEEGAPIHIIIIGCGVFGSSLAKLLSNQGHKVMVVDKDGSQFERLASNYNVLEIIGMATDEDVLRAAGIMKVDTLMAVTSDDNLNMMISQMAKEIFQVPNVICCITDPEKEPLCHELELQSICPTDLGITKCAIMVASSSSMRNRKSK